MAPWAWPRYLTTAMPIACPSPWLWENAISWSETEDGYPLRTLNEVALRDCGPVCFNAYPDASASLRSLAEDRGLDLSVLIEAAEANTLRDLIFPTSDEPEPGDPHSVVRHPGTYR